MSTERSAGPLPVADLSYEEARDELVAIVARIEGGGAALEESMELWERGEALAAHCKDKLDQAQEQLDRGAAGTGRDAEDDGTDDSDDA
ncbi:exodeoxyribonuclease VII small subunit [Ornithinimicrobium sp. F0845]|uniref:exodeoxyribonuclease VII small subunit n=1 Tax=Ornithinimicrobium sp. F0845 TaxID=2926412 RepID=UPI001FF3B46E|nr:exodeoxyribonuclease VII small subunit [Ornithinimicrobium sp. F0845]MCK0111009.1 exodeoxyribonuclease VII small subunit [Ornithinimicrobium sp. F0845]